MLSKQVRPVSMRVSVTRDFIMCKSSPCAVLCSFLPALLPSIACKLSINVVTDLPLCAGPSSAGPQGEELTLVRSH